MVKWTSHARNQLQRIHEHIAQDSPLYAGRVCEEIVKKTIGLDELPRKGRMTPELNVDAIRELSLYSYRILYEIKPDGVIDVLALIHKRQHVEADDIGLQGP